MDIETRLSDRFKAVAVLLCLCICGFICGECHYLFLISHSFDASGGLGFVIVALPGYIHLYFGISEVSLNKNLFTLLVMRNMFFSASVYY